MEKKVQVMIFVILVESMFIGYDFKTDMPVDYLEEYGAECDDIFMKICFDNESEYYKFDLTIGEYNKESYEIAELLRYPRLLAG